MEISRCDSQLSYLDGPADLPAKEPPGSPRIPAALSPVPRDAAAATVAPGEPTRILLVNASHLHESWDDRQARAWWMDNLPNLMEH